MSRLDSFIRRLEAQRACLDMAAKAIDGLPGPVLELGLGNGRTFDHLRTLLPDREILVFEREVRAHPDCIPAADHLILGDIQTTLPEMLPRLSKRVALVHSDIGTGDAERNRKLAAWLSATMPAFLTDGAWIVADQALVGSGLAQKDLPAGIAPDRYFVYQRAPA